MIDGNKSYCTGYKLKKIEERRNGYEIAKEGGLLCNNEEEI